VRRGLLTAGVVTLPVVLLLVALVLTVLGERVSGTSMEPALPEGARVLVDPFAYRSSLPHRGDVVVLRTPDRAGAVAVKRVIGLPGDIVMMRPGRSGGAEVLVRPASRSRWYRVVEPSRAEADLRAVPCCDATGHATGEPTGARVPPGTYFLLGDNRQVSVDSRAFGWVPHQNLQGKVRLVLRGWRVTTEGLGSPALRPVPEPTS
jgi:signal peptidase I